MGTSRCTTGVTLTGSGGGSGDFGAARQPKESDTTATSNQARKCVMAGSLPVASMLCHLKTAAHYSTTMLEARATLHQATVGEDRRRRHVAGPGAGEERHHAGDLLGLGHPPQRDYIVERLEEFWVLEGRRVDGRRHRTRAHAHDEDVMARQLDSTRARQHAHAALGQAVGDVARHWPVLVHRGDVDDAPAAALLDHLLGGDLRPKKGALQVDV